MATTQDSRAPELSRVLEVSDLSDGPIERQISATPTERAALARRLGLEDLVALDADVRVAAGAARGTYMVSGRLVGVVVQTCVVTLGPVENRIEMEFDTDYAGDEPPTATTGDFDDYTPPEPVIDGRIDLGEEVVQQLACGIDPYPRAKGAKVDPEWAAESDDGAPSGPFAALSELRRRD